MKLVANLCILALALRVSCNYILSFTLGQMAQEDIVTEQPWTNGLKAILGDTFFP